MIYGSASFGALGPNSDVDVLADGDSAAIESWSAEAQRVTGREVNVSGVAYMRRQPMMVQQILDTPIVLRDTRQRLAEMQRELDEDGRLYAFQMRTLGEALDAFPQAGPDRPITGAEQRFMEALAGVRIEYRRMLARRTPHDRQWAAERLTRRIRNLLRNWPRCGDYVQPRQTIEALSGALSKHTVEVLRGLPYEEARPDPVDIGIDASWTKTQALLREATDDLVGAAQDALCASLEVEPPT